VADIDFKKLAEGGAGQAAQPLPVGSYTFVCVKAVSGKTSAGDKDAIKCTFVVEGGARNGAPAWNQFTLTTDSEQSMALFFRQMAAMGLALDFFKTLPPGSAGVAKVAEAMVQRRVVASIEHEPYNGEARARMTGFKPATGGAPGPVPGGVVPLAGAIRLPTAAMSEVQPQQQPQPQAAPQPTATAPAPAPALPVAETFDPDSDEPF
jgi:hypothetical protein